MAIDNSNETGFVKALTAWDEGFYSDIGNAVLDFYNITGPYSFTGNAGQAATITYSFDDALAAYSGLAVLSGEDVAPLFVVEEQFIEQAMQQWANVANLTFTAHDSSAPLNLLFGEAGDVNGTLTIDYPANASGHNPPANNVKAETMHVNTSGSTATKADVIFREPNLSEYTFETTTSNQWWYEPGQLVTVGSFASGEVYFPYATTIHEIGHALGLSHPEGDEGSANYNRSLTIMSSENKGGMTSETLVATPMIYDIAAMQFLYGRNDTYEAGDSAYTFDGGHKAWTVWDAGGTDTFDASSHGGGVTLDLRGGVDDKGTPANLSDDVARFSQVGNERIAIAFDTIIEHATGGSGNDTIYGNDGNNRLTGGGGNDTLEGGIGNDQLKGGADDDAYVFSGAYGHDTIDDSDGVGSIKIGGVTIGGQATLDTETGRWALDDHPTYYLTNSGNDMVLHKDGDSSNDITIKDFTTGEEKLGISLIQTELTFEFSTTVNAWEVGGSTSASFIMSYTVNPARMMTESAGPGAIWYFPVSGTVTVAGQSTDFNSGKIFVNNYIDNAPPPYIDEYKVRIEEGSLFNQDVRFIQFHLIDPGQTMLSSTALPTNADFVVHELSQAFVSLGDGGVNIANSLTVHNPLSLTLAGLSLTGTDSANHLAGSEGGDYAYAKGGDDYVDLAGGDDTIVAGSGEGNDTYIGGAGFDEIIYTSATQGITVNLATGIATGTEIDTDSLSGIEKVISGSGNDLITGATADEDFIGGAGNDTITAGAGNDSVLAGSGDDSVSGEAGDDYLSGYLGDDFIDGGAGADSLEGGDGNDTLLGGDGDDVIDGSLGDDSIDAGEGANQVIAGDGADSIVSGSGNDTLDGGSGSDTMYGGTGDDSILGGDSADLIYGEGSFDTIDGQSGDDTIYGGSRDDVLMGSSGNDFLNGGTFDDTLDGGSGHDILEGDDGEDSLEGGSGDDSLTGDFGDDTLKGGVGNDTLDGGFGSDSLNGGSDHDLLLGGFGDDTLTGYHGDDTLDGGFGVDTLSGGDGADVFKFSDLADSTAPGSRYDRITDFEDGIDLIDLSGLGFTTLTSNGSTQTGELRLAYSSASDRTYVRSDQSDFEFYLDGDYTGTLTNSDFVF